MSINISTFTVWITIEGVSCPIYGLKSTTSVRDAACWIPSQEGKKFSVNWSNKFRDRPVFAQLSIDGVVCSTHFMLDVYNHPEDADSIGVSYATTSDFTRRDFVFSAIQVTDDDAYLYTLDNPPAFGTIRLELWEADIERIVRAPFQHRYGSDVLESQIIHETSKKAGAHQVKFGGEYVVPQPTVNMVSGTRKPGTLALATFTFNYRPFDILLAGGIIPRPKVTVKTEPTEGVDQRIHDLEAQLAILRAQKAGSISPSPSPSRSKPKPKPKSKSQWHSDPLTGTTVQVIDLTDL